MVYVFTFLGEFGFELLIWQGVIRKFAQTIPPSDTIVCCSRANLYPLYESADLYIDISDIKLFKRSRARGYHAVPDESGRWDLQAWLFNRRIRPALQAEIRKRLEEHGIEKDDPCTFIFSSNGISLNGLTFGRTGYRYTLAGALVGNLYYGLESAFPAHRQRIKQLKLWLFRTVSPLDHRVHGNIYEHLALENNIYEKIEPNPVVSIQVAEQLGWDLAEPYVLCQTRRRDSTRASRDLLPSQKVEQLVETLAKQVRVVTLSFHTGRRFDSYSEFDDCPSCFRYHCTSFPEQASLIHSANHCLFFTEGDFGSHIYVPPLMGRDVTVVAPRSVYELSHSPIDFWNRSVFRFGGQIIPKVSEDVFASEDNLAEFVRDIASCVATKS